MLTSLIIYFLGDHFPSEEVFIESSNENIDHFPNKLAAKKTKIFPPKEQNKRYSFFETLYDSELKKQVGLSGKVEVSPKPKPKAMKSLQSVTIGSLGKINQENVPLLTHKTKQIKEDEKLSDKYTVQPFLVQAASFRKLDHAQNMVNKYKRIGYAAFMKKSKSQSGDLWYRVYLGRFNNRERALEVVRLARSKERLEPIIVLQQD